MGISFAEVRKELPDLVAERDRILALMEPYSPSTIQNLCGVPARLVTALKAGRYETIDWCILEAIRRKLPETELN